VLAPHGSICVELGDTFSGNNQTGWHRAGDEAPDRYRDFGAIASTTMERDPSGWPLAKSLTGIPTLYTWSLAYARNLLTGVESPAGQWRIRNVIVWARPNPPVGALGDKFRPATSYITVACKGPKRYFDLDGVRVPFSPNTNQAASVMTDGAAAKAAQGGMPRLGPQINTHAGAPPLDWHADDHPEDGDWLWKLSTQPYKGSHYATYPLRLPTRLIEAMCPQRVCVTCGKPSERIVGDAEYTQTRNGGKPATLDMRDGESVDGMSRNWSATGKAKGDNGVTRNAPTLGWTDCGHDNYRSGVVLDPFAGSGTTLEAAQNVGRHAIGIDIDARNADLAQERVGMFLEIKEAA